MYGGGQWHALTHAFASYMMDLIDTQPKLLTYFQTSYAPDEMLFQTILFNSPFRDHTFKKVLKRLMLMISIGGQLCM